MQQEFKMILQGFQEGRPIKKEPSMLMIKCDPNMRGGDNCEDVVIREEEEEEEEEGTEGQQCRALALMTPDGESATEKAEREFKAMVKAYRFFEREKQKTMMRLNLENQLRKVITNEMRIKVLKLSKESVDYKKYGPNSFKKDKSGLF